jgi:hypothetical protein
LFGVLVCPGGAVGFPCLGVVVGGPGVIVGVVLAVVGPVVVGVTGGAEGVVLDTGVVGRSPGAGVGVLVVAATGCSVFWLVFCDSPGFGVSEVRSGGCVTRCAGCCRPASGRGINGVLTRGPPSKLLTSSTTYATTGTATSAPIQRILR